MSSANKITFGNNTVGTNYTINPTTFGYASGDNVQTSYANYQQESTLLNGATTSSYQPYSAGREVVFGGQSAAQGYTTGTNYSTVQVGNPTGVQYGTVQDISRPAPVTKVTFGGKQYTETYVPRTQYQTTYVQPGQAYETYRQPVEITTVQPVVQETRVQTVQVEPPKREWVEEVKAVPSPVIEKPQAKKKSAGGCPSWLWILLGALLLLGIILGLLFWSGILGGKADVKATGPSVAANATLPAVNVTKPTANVTGTTFVTPTIDVPTVNVTTPTIPTINVPTVNVTTPTIDVPTINVPTVNVTTPTINVPTVNVTTPTIDVPTINVPTVNVTTPTVDVPTISTPTVVVPSTPTVVVPTVDTSDQFSFDPSSISPIPVASTTTTTTTTVPVATSWSSSSSWSTPSTGYTTYPTVDTTGYGSSPVVDTLTNAASSFSTAPISDTFSNIGSTVTTNPYVASALDYVQPTSAY